MKSIQQRKNLIITILFLAVIAGFFVALPIFQKLKLALPSHVDTLAEFSTEMPKPEKVIVFEKNDSSYVEVIGVRPSFPSVPSGPPVYIFDSKGHISYWTVDVGDTAEYWDNWQNRANSREVSMQEALKFVRQ